MICSGDMTSWNHSAATLLLLLLLLPCVSTLRATKILRRIPCKCEYTWLVKLILITVQSQWDAKAAQKCLFNNINRNRGSCSWVFWALFVQIPTLSAEAESWQREIFQEQVSESPSLWSQVLIQTL